MVAECYNHEMLAITRAGFCGAAASVLVGFGLAGFFAALPEVQAPAATPELVPVVAASPAAGSESSWMRAVTELVSHPYANEKDAHDSLEAIEALLREEAPEVRIVSSSLDHENGEVWLDVELALTGGAVAP